MCYIRVQPGGRRQEAHGRHHTNWGTDRPRRLPSEQQTLSAMGCPNPNTAMQYYYIKYASVFLQYFQTPPCSSRVFRRLRVPVSSVPRRLQATNSPPRTSMFLPTWVLYQLLPACLP
ncbi:hypothetical protein GDO81_021448 [Engystomops pustulosus]|uniref:Uncharacterized protein n=1 Tax=Engystomops pustulosus TaxID=76066 RepID=A0AAV6YVX1_ENGPU|nr:hypothetical protein GDO81_021448 [Engystomops pustulosus]